MSWEIKDTGYQPERAEFFGSKYLMGNGYMGYRGTMEEQGAERFAALNLAGLFDQNANSDWREPVNAPNPFRLRLCRQGEELTADAAAVAEHTQRLDLQKALHVRSTTYETVGGRANMTIERFASMAERQLLALELRFTPSSAGEITVDWELDDDIWDINGPHLAKGEYTAVSEGVLYESQTLEQAKPLAVAQGVFSDKCAAEVYARGHRLTCHLAQGETLIVHVLAAVSKENEKSAREVLSEAASLGYDALKAAHEQAWAELWDAADVQIDGDADAELALRHSLYLLLSSTPFHTDGLAIPARGLSGQVYKGAMFWDTELYMMPFFQSALPAACRNLVMYRVHTLNGARAKAKELGYSGAFYPWESQEDGREYCTYYNINDVFTGRPFRTYFRDGQIHISADVAYGIHQYVWLSSDTDLLLHGGAEVLLECARFLHSYSYFKPEKSRYELLDVTGADEYHERVNNNAYTNYMTAFALDAALLAASWLEENHPNFYRELLDRLHYDLTLIREMREGLYLPPPLPGSGIVEQNDGYLTQEDITPDILISRKQHPHEYLGSPVGLAVHTQVIKQADVVLVCALFPEKFTQSQMSANWAYYEKRTEHGSSLSACIYALVAARLGHLDYAYQYFMKAAQLDMKGDYKLYVGNQYIGGTHPASQGGSWMVAVQGFAGLSMKADGLTFTPALPKGWQEIRFCCCWQGQRCRVRVRADRVTVTADQGNTRLVPVQAFGQAESLAPGGTVVLHQGGGIK